MGSLCFGFSVLRCSIRSSRACVELGKKRDYALHIYIYIVANLPFQAPKALFWDFGTVYSCR